MAVRGVMGPRVGHVYKPCIERTLALGRAAELLSEKLDPSSIGRANELEHGR